MNTLRQFNTPELQSIQHSLEKIPKEALPWIAEKHIQYLDDKIHKIDILTKYLANCREVKMERNEFVEFVEKWTKQKDINFNSYLSAYCAQYRSIRDQVENILDRILNDQGIWASDKALLEFWNNFSRVNEIDSLHGMFLTSGRWYVNVALPPIKEIIFCCLPDNFPDNKRNEQAYLMSRRIITPEFAKTPSDYNSKYEKDIVSLLIPLFSYYDKKILFLFQEMGELSKNKEDATLMNLIDVSNVNSLEYVKLLDKGIYPPFAWHELQTSKNNKISLLSYDDATRRINSYSSIQYKDRLQVALSALEVIKNHEVDYNTYNYKGRFCLVSKYFYWRTIKLLREDKRKDFLDAILLDRFYDALNIIKNNMSERNL